MAALAIAYSDEIRAAIDGIDAFLRREVYPRHDRHERLLSDLQLKYSASGKLSADAWGVITEVRKCAAEAGFYAMCAPQEIGGSGMGFLAYFAAWEHIYRACGTKYWLGHHILSHWAKGPSFALQKLTQLAQAQYLPTIMSGEATLCFCLSEPEAGSDAAMIRARATPDGDGWRLSGSKIWTTNSPHADYAIVFAVTDSERAAARAGGISAFLVPTNSEGFKLGKIIRMWGSPGGDEAVIHFDGVRLERDQLMGELHQGFAMALSGVAFGRIYNCARSIGLARWAIEVAFDYIKIRKTFGKVLAEYQGVTFPLAESAMQIHAAHLMSINVAKLKDQGLPATKELAMTKAFSVEAGVRAIDRVIQAHGAIGMTNEIGLTEAYTTLRKICIADGTNEIMRRVVVKEMLKGDVAL